MLLNSPVIVYAFLYLLKYCQTKCNNKQFGYSDRRNGNFSQDRYVCDHQSLLNTIKS